MAAAKRIDLGAFAVWAEPERLYFNVEQAFRELAGGGGDNECFSRSPGVVGARDGERGRALAKADKVRIAKE